MILRIWICSSRKKTVLKEEYLRHTKDADITITEGVMGFYDGMSLDSVKGSSYDVAQNTGTAGDSCDQCKRCSNDTCS